MDFLNKLGGTITEAGNAVTAKAKEVSELAKLNSKLRGDENAIKATYEKMGKALYANLTTGTDLPDFAEELELIADMKADMKLCKEYIKAIKGTEICTYCGADVELGSAFCRHCGTKQNEN